MKKNDNEEARRSWALIPEAGVLDEYEPRMVRGMWDLDVIHVAMESKHNVLIYGPTGSAKTTLVRAYAAREELPFYAVPMNGAVDLQQMLGKWVPTEDGHFRWIDGPVTDIVKHGGVLLFDEMNYAPAKILAAVYSLLDSRRTLTLLDHEGEVIRCHDRVVIVAAMNKGSEYEGIRPLSAALANRFAHKLPFGYDRGVETALVPTMPSLLDLAAQLRSGFDEGELSTPISTNSLMEFEDFSRDERLGYDYAVENFISRFDDDEQPSVRQVFDLYSRRLRDESEVAEKGENFVHEE